MQYFTKDFLDFFKELSANNHKDWFHENKKRYESSVKKPFAAFLNDFFEEIRKHDTEFKVEAKDCIARINRDIRFAKDKTPYNTHYTAFASRGGKKTRTYLEFFFASAQKKRESWADAICRQKSNYMVFEQPLVRIFQNLEN